jgi:hypothetical protein
MLFAVSGRGKIGNSGGSVAKRRFKIARLAAPATWESIPPWEANSKGEPQIDIHFQTLLLIR